MNRFISIFLLLFPLACWAQTQQVYFVAVKGKDSNPGPIEKPFASLQKARNTVRTQRKLHPQDSIIVFIRKGSYFLSGIPFQSISIQTKVIPSFNHVNQ